MAHKVIQTELTILPDRFTHGPHTRQMSEYIAKRWTLNGIRRICLIDYNQPYEPEWNRHARLRFVEHADCGLRSVGKVHEIRMSGYHNMPYIAHSIVNHTGWYTNEFQDETAWGVVYQLPSRDGKWQYVPGFCSTYDENNPCLDFASITDDIGDAIRWADSMAESYAESAREYEAKENAKTRIEDITAEIRTIYRDLHKLAKAVKENCAVIAGVQPLVDLLKEKRATSKARVFKLRRERKQLEGQI